MLQRSNLPVLGGIIWVAAAVIIAIFLIRRRYLHLIGINLLAFSAFTILVLTPALFVSDASRQLPLKQLSQLAAQIQEPGEEIVMIGFKKPSVAFYAESKINYIKTNQKAADYIRNEAKSGSILVLAEPKRFPKLGLESTEYKQLAEKQAYGLIRVNISEQ